MFWRRLTGADPPDSRQVSLVAVAAPRPLERSQRSHPTVPILPWPRRRHPSTPSCLGQARPRQQLRPPPPRRSWQKRSRQHRHSRVLACCSPAATQTAATSAQGTAAERISRSALLTAAPLAQPRPSGSGPCVAIRSGHCGPNDGVEGIRHRSSRRYGLNNSAPIPSTALGNRGHSSEATGVSGQAQASVLGFPPDSDISESSSMTQLTRGGRVRESGMTRSNQA